MKNPDKYLRAAFISDLSSKTGLPVFDKAVPISVTNPPNRYYTVDSQSKTPTAQSKRHWEWNCSLTVSCIAVQTKGYNSTAEVDDMEADAMMVAHGLQVPEFRFVSGTFVDSITSDIETQTNTVNRKIVMYEYWLNKEI